MMGLGALKKYDLALVKALVENSSHVNDVGADALGVGQQTVGNLVWIDSATVVDLHQDLVLLV